MYNASDAEMEMAKKVRSITGKKMRTCVFCVRYARGNLTKALELCGSDPKEDGR